MWSSAIDAEIAVRLKLLLADAEEKGFVHYKELGGFFPDTYIGGPELDDVLRGWRARES